MYHKDLQKLSSKQHGGALAIAVFVIVVMSLLAAAISGSISASTEQNNYEVLGTRAKLAAESGLEFMLGDIFPVTGAALSCDGGISQQYYFANVAGLEQCSVMVNCNESDPADTVAVYYQVDATGVCKTTLSGSTGSEDPNDTACANTDAFCVSRTMEVEAKAL